MPSQFRISGLTKSYGRNTVVENLDLTIENGEFLVLLGPSGCGKTTTLRCIAGLETPDAGSIVFGDRPVFDAASRTSVPPHKRNIGMVFQSYALWPNMTVRDNIRYPLKVRRMKQAIAAGRVEEAAEMVDCGALLDRYPSQLSGGQQQRVAVARGLAAQPQMVLFDEPLSNLDARLRDQVRTQIHQLHERLGFTAVFVTHDQSEAFALGDKIAIMRAGRIEQYDAPDRVFEEPATDYVAAFVGMSNRLAVTRGDRGWITPSGTLVELPGEIDAREAVLRLRPEDVALHRTADTVSTGHVKVAARLLSSEYGGRHYDVLVDAAGEQFHLRADARLHADWLRRATEDTPATISFDPHQMRVFAGDGSTADGIDERAATATVPA